MPKCLKTELRNPSSYLCCLDLETERWHTLSEAWYSSTELQGSCLTHAGQSYRAAGWENSEREPASTRQNSQAFQHHTEKEFKDMERSW